MKVWLVIRTAPSLAIMGAFSTKPTADALVDVKGLQGKCIIEEWNVA